MTHHAISQDENMNFENIAMGLCRLRTAAEYSHEFTKRCSKFMTPSDKAEMAEMAVKQDAMFYKYWEKLVKKIRGF